MVIIAIFTYGIHWAFFDMDRLPKHRMIAEVSSPDEVYTIKAYIPDGGATTSYAVLGELNFNNLPVKPKNIYWNYREDKADIRWIDNDTVVINGHQLNVPHERFDFRREKQYKGK